MKKTISQKSASRKALHLEHVICKAEIAYKSGRIQSAVTYACRALLYCESNSTKIALKIFMARAYSKLGCYDKSNTIYRDLLRQNIYMPPVIMGLLYNNIKTAPMEKLSLNIKLVKTCLHLH